MVPLVIHEGGHDWSWWQQTMLDDISGILHGKACGDLDWYPTHSPASAAASHCFSISLIFSSGMGA
ncbi:hypothetical protein E5345_11840 [Propionibacterium sp. NM47_B9-13]|uniref:Uncharacterized protein n=1 Tax=Cutibacterium modestum HL044PA1 TaxID=765109 RepID=A0ABN0C7T1_9ACTN|nr:hypothetical protein BCB70_12090 [Cutibacterium modestum]EFS74616.1 hypothetical protein HMPREF9621_00892 [Cutibacterium modestum HL037PA2]EFS93339.1 hypothetical protein HMPREF9607_00552 [Cutibacterium modestum HL044PA1]EGG26674.1 hypothetical protein PA08_0908 [Cutibacterium modestum P08]MCP2375523.1 enterochelin esterase-like enzyme [Cutibacterium modestum 28N]MCP2378697.1 enterochelin esterase-like enzyme [Cutibacterium modestum 31N]TGY27759.1 hypothetical protein E5345_11840 [Propioni